MGAVLTSAGATLIATRFANNMGFEIDKIEIGSLTSSQRYDALVTATALVDATPKSITGTASIPMNALNNVVQITVQDDSTDVYNASEVGFFVGTTLVFLVANLSGNLFSKTADLAALASLVASFTNGVLTGDLAFAVSQMPPATQAQAEAGTDNSTTMTPLRTREVMEYTQKFPRTAGLAMTFDQLRQQGVWNVRNPGAKADGPTTTETDSKLEVVHTAYRNLGRLVMVQELSLANGMIFTRKGTIQGTAGTVPDWDGSPLPTATWSAWTRTGLQRATQAQATAGTDNTTAMTPLRTTDAINARIDGRITISDSAPQSSDGSNNDIWLEY